MVDQFVVMPNHFHGIIQILSSNPVGADPCVCPVPEPCVCPTTKGSIVKGHADRKAGGHISPPLPAIVQWFKTMTTNEYIRGVKQHGWAAFSQRLWQRNYYEHVVRNDLDLNDVREYILSNPKKWALDRENPINRR